MKEACAHDQERLVKVIHRPYYDEIQLICCKCHEVVDVKKQNNLISSRIGTQDPTQSIIIGEDVYELSFQAKAILKQYEFEFSWINQIAERLPEGQSDPAIITLFECLKSNTHEKLCTEDCCLVSSNQRASEVGEILDYVRCELEKRMSEVTTPEIQDVLNALKGIFDTLCIRTLDASSSTLEDLNRLMGMCEVVSILCEDSKEKEIFQTLGIIFKELKTQICGLENHENKEEYQYKK